MKKSSYSPEEQNLIEKCKKGDFRAFRELVEKYQSRIYAVCYGILRNREDVFDVMQEIFIKLYGAMDSFKGETGIYIWIYRISVNACYDFLRKKKRKNALLQRMKTEPSHTHVKKPDELTLTIELKEQIKKGIEKLPNKLKEAIVLREIEGLSYQEMAKVMKCSLGTVMSRLFYARKKLVSYLDPYVFHQGVNDEKTAM